MPQPTPLLLLLNSIISADEAAVESSMQAVVRLLRQPDWNDWTLPLRSTDCLCHVVQMIVGYYPHMASIPSEHDGSLPLHFAASLGISNVAEILWRQYPTAATTPNARGKTPLHYAAREGRLDMVRFLVTHIPVTATIASDKQKLPLHLAAADGHVQVVRDLLAVYPLGASSPSAKGKLPLHLAARWGHEQVAYDLHSVYPAGVTMRDWDGNLPLHDTAREGHLAMSKYLIHLYPEGLTLTNLRGEIPLLPAVRSGNIELVGFMLKVWPAGAKHIVQFVHSEEDLDDWEILELLLRGAVQNFYNCRLMEDLQPPTVILTDQSVSHPAVHEPTILKRPRAIQASSRNDSTDSTASDITPTLWDIPNTIPSPCGGTGTSRPASISSMRKRSFRHEEENPFLREIDLPPIPTSVLARKRQTVETVTIRPFFPVHAAFEAQASFEVLKVVLREKPDNQNERDAMGRLPIHWACAYPRNDKVLKLIEDEEMVTPSSASARDGKNQLPLHIALAQRADVRLISSLLQAYPAAAVEKCHSRDRWFHYRPLDMACHYDCDVSTIYELLRVKPCWVRR